MRPKEYTKLKFVGFRYVGNWSVSHILGQRIGFNEKYLSQPIGSFVKRSSVSTNVRNECQYKQVTLKTKGGGAVLRDIKLGKDIGTKKQYVVSEGQFIMSKIDARNGAFGIVPNDLDGAIVTADFPLFDIETDIINPVYFSLISSTNAFARFAQSCSRGTTNRQRIDINLFLSQQVPLPTLSEQQVLVKAYKDKIQQAESLERQANQVEKEIEIYLLNELGINEQKKSEDSQNEGFKFLKFIRFKNANRWDVSYYSKKNSIGGKYEITTMDDCIDHFMQDPKACTLRIETSKSPEKEFQYIGMESVEKGSGLLVEEKKVKGIEVKSQTVRVPYHYFLYGKLRPYLNKYWYNESKNDDIVCSSEFFVFSIKPEINESYFKYYLSSAAVQQQISNAFQGARMPRINERTFKAIQVPIPPIDIQNAIVEHINEQKAQIKKLKKQAEELRKKALVEFEKEIFE